MGQTTITVHDDTLERFKAAKAVLNESQPDCPDHSNESFLNTLLDTWEVEGDTENVGEIAENAVELFQEQMSQAHINDETTEFMAREFARQIDYNDLAKNVADELEARMR